jgi:hypothetical protein
VYVVSTRISSLSFFHFSLPIGTSTSLHPAYPAHSHAVPAPIGSLRYACSAQERGRERWGGWGVCARDEGKRMSGKRCGIRMRDGGGRGRGHKWGRGRGRRANLGRILAHACSRSRSRRGSRRARSSRDKSTRASGWPRWRRTRVPAARCRSVVSAGAAARAVVKVWWRGQGQRRGKVSRSVLCAHS